MRFAVILKEIFDDEFAADTEEELREFLDETVYFKGCSAEKLDI